MFGELTDAYNELDKNDDLRVGILFAHGKHTTGGGATFRFVECWSCESMRYLVMDHLEREDPHPARPDQGSMRNRQAA